MFQFCIDRSLSVEVDERAVSQVCCINVTKAASSSRCSVGRQSALEWLTVRKETVVYAIVIWNIEFILLYLLSLMYHARFGTGSYK